ncbi:hypothetical protein U0070_014594, partial [Myodes glareolus]
MMMVNVQVIMMVTTQVVMVAVVVTTQMVMVVVMTTQVVMVVVMTTQVVMVVVTTQVVMVVVMTTQVVMVVAAVVYLDGVRWNKVSRMFCSVPGWHPLIGLKGCPQDRDRTLGGHRTPCRQKGKLEQEERVVQSQEVPASGAGGALHFPLAGQTSTLFFLCNLGVNECEDTTTCPAYATCTDTADSYYCTCKRGFQSSNGQTNFKGPGVECKDVDECLQSDSPCGPNSVCKNLPGRSQCSCISGFSPPTGKSWILGSSDHFLCKDIDECLKSGICPANSNCSNSVGSYKCTCQPGFFWNGLVCEDKDECAEHDSCPENASCHNTFGSYHCTCDSGLESSGGGPTFQGLGESCEDVDECSRNSTLCGPTLICINTLGSYTCSCPTGFSWSLFVQQILPVQISMSVTPCALPTHHARILLGATSALAILALHQAVDKRLSQIPKWHVKILMNVSKIHPHVDKILPAPMSQAPTSAAAFPTSGQIQKDPRHTATSVAKGFLSSASFCTLVNATFSILDNTCENKSAPVSLQSAAMSISLVLKQVPMWTEISREETSALGTVVLETVESAMLATLLTPSGNVSQTIRTENLDIESKVINEECNDENASFNLKARGDEMKVDCSIIEESESTGTPGVAFVSFANMESVLDERFFEDGQASWKLKMNSRVVGGTVTGEKKEDFSKTVVYTLQHIQPKQKSERPICVSWNPNMEDGRWTRSGCEITKASETYTECSCNRMANLAIIMASQELTV